MKRRTCTWGAAGIAAVALGLATGAPAHADPGADPTAGPTAGSAPGSAPGSDGWMTTQPTGEGAWPIIKGLPLEAADAAADAAAGLIEGIGVPGGLVPDGEGAWPIIKREVPGLQGDGTVVP